MTRLDATKGDTMRLYIRHPRRDTWHWVRACHHLRRLIAAHGMGWLTRTERRPRGEFCNECRAKARKT